jgi:limonene-1,2-epoxide hydrolase
MTNANEQIIKRFLVAWSNLDPNELTEYFTEDGIYHNIPTSPTVGKEQVRAQITGICERWTKTSWDLVTIASNDNLVIAERVDRTEMGDKKVDLPCTGVFEMEDGKIKVWRDYFDLNTFRKAME